MSCYKQINVSTFCSTVVAKVQPTPQFSDKCSPAPFFMASPGASTDLVTVQPHLNSDVLELIFRHLDFRDLLAAELVCRKWKEVVDGRRLFKQLARKICNQRVNISFSRRGFSRHLREVRMNRYKKKRKK